MLQIYEVLKNKNKGDKLCQGLYREVVCSNWNMKINCKQFVTTLAIIIIMLDGKKQATLNYSIYIYTNINSMAP